MSQHWHVDVQIVTPCCGERQVEFCIASTVTVNTSRMIMTGRNATVRSAGSVYCTIVVCLHVAGQAQGLFA